MKLAINYDLMDRICDAREPYNTLKIVRNHKNEWIRQRIPILILLNIFLKPSVLATVFVVVTQNGIDILSGTMVHKINNEDYYALRAEEDLKKLVLQLQSSFVDTDYDLLLKSEESLRKYKIKINEKKFPCLLEEKYILVPTKTQTDDVIETSLLQEHIVGSKQWTLSLGSPTKQKKLVPVHAKM